MHFRLGKPLTTLAAVMFLATGMHAEGTPYAPQVGELWGLPITNAMVTSWIISLAIVIGVRLMLGRPKLVPSRGQAFVESLVEGVRSLIEPIVGKRMVAPTFWLLSGLFTYIMIHNWSGLLPGVGTIGWGHEGAHGFHITTPLVRPANADVNMTAALAAVAMVCWFYYIMRYAGPVMVLKDLFGNKANRAELARPVYYFLTLIFLFVGLIEILSIVLRPVTLTFRLFGNVFGGENLLHSMYGIFEYVVPLPFYFMELLVGFVQALVFTLLVSVYIGLICNHDAGEGGHH